MTQSARRESRRPPPLEISLNRTLPSLNRTLQRRGVGFVTFFNVEAASHLLKVPDGASTIPLRIPLVFESGLRRCRALRTMGECSEEPRTVASSLERSIVRIKLETTFRDESSKRESLPSGGDR